MFPCDQYMNIGFIECFTTIFLHTHHSLLAKLDEDEVGFKEKS